ncbi:MAG: M48 family metalloprotease [bacterium]|nr:M48 family metalloprotease [bacterium]
MAANETRVESPKRSWYFRTADKTVGPVSTAGLKALLEGGAVSARTLVWKAGMSDWVALGGEDLDDGFSTTESTTAAAADASGTVPTHGVELWYLDESRRKQGPLCEPDLVQLVEGDLITHDTLIWSRSLGEWRTAAKAGLALSERAQAIAAGAADKTGATMWQSVGETAGVAGRKLAGAAKTAGQMTKKAAEQGKTKLVQAERLISVGKSQQSGVQPADSAPDTSAPGEDGTRREPDWFRVENELLMLLIALGVTLAAFAWVTMLTLGLFFFLMVLGIVFVKIQQGQILGNSVQVTRTQLSEIHALAEEAAQRLGIEQPPQLFVQQDPSLNAYAMGIFGRKTIVLHSALIEALDEDELQAVIAHEMAHVHLGHTTWGTLIGQPAGIGLPILSDVLQFFFKGWSRKAEYSADRGALIGSRSLGGPIRSLGKLCVGKELFDQLDFDGLSEQKGDVDSDGVSRLSEALLTHPYIVNRIDALRRFADENPGLVEG